MEKEFDIQEYMTGGVKRVIRDAMRASLSNPKEAMYLARFASAAKQATARRNALKAQGEHIPPFLIASITSSCNLHCAGCYSRSNHACSDAAPTEQLSDQEWGEIFREAEQLGMSFILLAGGEPLLRKDVITQASFYENILFPIFTNGVFLGEDYVSLFHKHRNLFPVLSIEGNEAATDARRGAGIYKRMLQNMKVLSERGILFGASITVTTENLDEVYSTEYLSQLAALGCKAVIFVEFVPVTEEATYLAPDEAQREMMQLRMAALRKEMPEMVFIAFPGDEKSSGGCLAAGRGFFHINSHGGAEPCPFSPYSDTNVRDASVREALKSPLFYGLQEEGLLLDDHVGGCTLFANRARVEKMLQKNATLEI